jgi:hypothetical protein
MVVAPNIPTAHPPCDRIPEVYFFDTLGGTNFLPQEWVDITDTFEQKKRMLAAVDLSAG